MEFFLVKIKQKSSAERGRGGGGGNQTNSSRKPSNSFLKTNEKKEDKIRGEMRKEFGWI
jgi:hypothetical protein